VETAQIKQIGFYIVSVEFIFLSTFLLSVERFCFRKKRHEDEGERVI
jgi:hypothetical protein